MNIAVAAESIPLEDLKTGKTGENCRYFKMKVLDGHTSEQDNEFVRQNI